MIEATLTHLFKGAGWGVLLWFTLALLILDIFDIELPRGDSIGVGGAICAAAAIVVGPVPAAAMLVVSAALTHAVRWRSVGVHRLPQMAIGRLLAVVAMWAVSLIPFRTMMTIDFIGPALASAVFLLTEVLVAQTILALRTNRPFLRLLAGSVRMQAPLLAAQWSVAVLVVITYGKMGRWSLVPVVALLLLMRQSYAFLLEIRETYRMTVEVLVEAAESQDPRRIGHAERTAAGARAIAMRTGIAAPLVERISYAALLHDLDALAEGASTTSVDGDSSGAVGHSSDVLKGAVFFEDVVGILRICDGDGAFAGRADPRDVQAAFIVALASDADAAEHLGVAETHQSSAVDRVADFVPQDIKAQAVAAALGLGYRIPAVR
jgi:hypothetical protein